MGAETQLPYKMMGQGGLCDEEKGNTAVLWRKNSGENSDKCAQNIPITTGIVFL